MHDGRKKTLMDTIALRDAYRALLDAAATVADSGEPGSLPPTGEWTPTRSWRTSPF